MWKNIAFYAAVLVACVGVCAWSILDARPEPFHAPLSDLVAFGDDASLIGQLAEPVTAKVIVYDANADAPEIRTIRLPTGTWLTPESVYPKPY